MKERLGTLIGGTRMGRRNSLTGETWTSVDLTARCKPEKSRSSRRKRTSRLAGWTFTSTSDGGTVSINAAMGCRPTGKNPW